MTSTPRVIADAGDPKFSRAVAVAAAILRLEIIGNFIVVDPFREDFILTRES
jgi:hypothetical protein